MGNYKRGLAILNCKKGSRANGYSKEDGSIVTIIGSNNYNEHGFRFD